MLKRWIVQLHGTKEQIEADEVEISASGALAFYRFASRMDSERTLLVAFSSSSWQQCRLESDG